MNGQLDLDGGEAIDPRIDKAARALYWRDVKRRHYDAGEDKPELAKQGWQRVGKYYVEAATVALTAAGVL